MKQTVEEMVEQLFPVMVERRRYLHQHPELSFHEVDTPRFIAERLTELGIEVRTGVGGRGVVGTIRGGQPGKTVALRADFDALPIQDEKEVDYRSTVPGVMHACGHDGHTATLLAVAEILVGQKANDINNAAGGGGGSFVSTNANVPFTKDLKVGDKLLWTGTSSLSETVPKTRQKQ